MMWDIFSSKMRFSVSIWSIRSSINAFFLALVFKWAATLGGLLSILHFMSRSLSRTSALVGKENYDLVSFLSLDFLAKQIHDTSTLQRTFCRWRSWQSLMYLWWHALFWTGRALRPRSIAARKNQSTSLILDKSCEKEKKIKTRRRVSIMSCSQCMRRSYEQPYGTLFVNTVVQEKIK